MLEVYRVMWERFGRRDPQYNWFLRLWEDNYALAENVVQFFDHDVYVIYGNEAALAPMRASRLGRQFQWRGGQNGTLPDFNQPVVMANVGSYEQGLFGMRQPLLGGGPGWALNRPALELLAKKALHCAEWIATNRDVNCKFWCEDVLIGECLRYLGVQIVPLCGAFGWPPIHKYSCRVAPEQLFCHSQVHAHRCPNNGHGHLGECPLRHYHPLFFHYMTPEQMWEVEKAWYPAEVKGAAADFARKCDAALPVELRPQTQWQYSTASDYLV
jgi:hypothetical protein